jgi:integrase
VKRIVLTDRAVQAAKPRRDGKIRYLSDAFAPGLKIAVLPTGAKPWIAQPRLFGRQIKLTFGHFPDMPLVVARERARAAFCDIAAGIDPRVKRDRERAALARELADTFATVADEFLRRHVAGLKSAVACTALVRNELIPALGKKPVTAITRRDIVEIVERIVDSGRPEMARKTFLVASKFFSWAQARDLYGLESNPCRDVKLSEIVGRTTQRDRVLGDDEVAALWHAADCLDPIRAALVRTFMLTGQRRNEISEMRWAEIDFEKLTWTIPASRMKNGADHLVPLSDPVVEILKGLSRCGEFVFSGNGRTAIANFSNMKARLDAALPSGMPAWAFHDLRRTVRTGLTMLHVPDVVAELTIAHAQRGLHKVYDRHAYADEKRAALAAWSNHVIGLVTPQPAGKVVRIRAKR